MASARQHRILIATNGSPSAQAALLTALKFPWPASAVARAVVARCSWLLGASEHARAAVEKSLEAAADTARRALARCWPESEVVVVDARPVDAVLGEAERFEASVIVLGWRGHGVFCRLLAGSVSHRVAARARGTLLVVRKPVSALRCVVVGFDGCASVEHALDFLGSLEPGHGSRVVLVTVVEPVIVPASLARSPTSVRSRIPSEVATINRERFRQGQAVAAAGVARLERSGWTAHSEVRAGAPLASLLKAVAEHRADLLVLGARATSGLELGLLGSVANGALNSSPVLLLVR